MKRVHENLEPKDFADSEFVTHRYYCMSTGLLATDLCEHKAEGWYKTNTPLPGACTQHKGEVLPPIVPQPEVPRMGKRRRPVTALRQEAVHRQQVRVRPRTVPALTRQILIMTVVLRTQAVLQLNDLKIHRNFSVDFLELF